MNKAEDVEGGVLISPEMKMLEVEVELVSVVWW